MAIATANPIANTTVPNMKRNDTLTVFQNSELPRSRT